MADNGILSNWSQEDYVPLETCLNEIAKFFPNEGSADLQLADDDFAMQIALFDAISGEDTK